MQFHLNGFQVGDPDISPADDLALKSHNEALPQEVDVLIVGSGPAGLTLAAQLSVFPSIKTCLAEQKDGPMHLGQADGVACRSVEMFNTFGFAERLLKEAYWVNETTFWKPDVENPEHICRTGRVQDVEDGLSEFPHVILNQARVHDFYLEFMKHSPTRLEPAYSRQLLGLEIAPNEADSNTHPVTAVFKRLNTDNEEVIETIKARYIVGCDGARSVVRQSMGRHLEGDSANKAWGVMDVLAVTDFPDIRMKSIIQSANEGSILVIPREGGYLIRLYVELDKLRSDERVSSRNITSGQLIAAAKRIFHPYKIEIKEIAWWSVYEIGQRLCDKFDDVPEAEIDQRLPHVFIAGDACHTHSPKAGQGMNVSMRDTFNLGWKLASVLQGQCIPELLHSYTQERQGVAKMLIDFDKEWSSIMASRTNADENGESTISAEKFQEYFVKSGRYTAGTAIQYKPSMISGELTHQQLATGFGVGMRFHSAPVIRVSDAKPMHLGHVIKADGRWRLFAFAPAKESTDSTSKLHQLCEFLTDSQSSPLRKYTAESADIDSVFDVRAVFQQDFRELAIESIPELLLPKKGQYGLIDYEKIFCADLKSGEDIFDMRGVDRAQGCLVVVRPDQHVAQVIPLDAYGELSTFFDGFMIPHN